MGNTARVLPPQGIGGSIPPTANGERLILVVDDEATIRKTLAGALSDEGFKTETASDGEEAIRKVAELHPDLVFLDIWMPGLDGVQTLERIKELSPETGVVMMSGHATIATALEASRRGAFDFIEKPLDLGSIILTTARAFEQMCPDEFEARAAKRGRTGASTDPVLTHQGLLSTGLRGKNVGQRTLKRSIILYGQCLHTGQKSGLILEPLPPNSGVHFAKIGKGKTIPAFVDYVQSTGFATTIRYQESAAATIEHLLAALHAYKISNLLIKCNAEVPIFDGSALEFCKVIDDIGIEEQPGDWFEIEIDREIEVTVGGQEKITVSPAPSFSIAYELNYPAPVGKQSYEFTLDLESFRREIAPARTFGFMRDIEKLQRSGLAAGGRLDNFILVGDDRVINTDLRFPDEFVRHKILDVIGDLFLIGRPLCGRVVAKMTGHSDNIKLLTAIRNLAVTEL
jgi:UDP-3-O-acyl N-acetylglucosamine deacetylase